MAGWCCVLQLVLLTAAGGAFAANQRNIVFIVADDLGWNDVGWHNPRMKTPNLDALAENGVILDQAYVQPTCTPSRAAFMTGYYPFHMGRQHGVIRPATPTGIPLHLTMFPELLKRGGYKTHMVGKWHLGYCAWQYTPTYRGFDSHFGFFLGSQDFYSHSAVFKGSRGLDFRDNERVAREYTGQYSTIVFADRASQIIAAHDSSSPLFLYLPFQAPHTPLQVPERFENLYPNIEDDNRRTYSGMVSALDEAVGNITRALKKKGIFDDTLIVFISDNGGEKRTGNNWPLRGNKYTLWEGGTRAAAFASGSGIRKTGYTSRAMIHAVDWMPTLLAAADVSFDDSEIDGKNQWPAVSVGSSSARTEFVYNINEVDNGEAIRMGDFKLLVGNVGSDDGWYPEPGTKQSAVAADGQMRDEDSKDGEDLLFNLKDDPEERVNLAGRLSGLVGRMKERLDFHRETLHPAVNPRDEPNASPNLWFYTFSPGWCNPDTADMM